MEPLSLLHIIVIWYFSIHVSLFHANDIADLGFNVKDNDNAKWKVENGFKLQNLSHQSSVFSKIEFIYFYLLMVPSWFCNDKDIDVEGYVYS